MRHIRLATLFGLSLALSVGPVQAALSTPAKTDPNEPYVKTTCNSVPHGTVTGRVTSSEAIQIPKFDCGKFDGQGSFGHDFAALGRYPGPCENPTPRLTWGHGMTFGRDCPNRLTLHVQLANPADASKMPPGKLVTLTGDFSVITQNKTAYLLVQNARVLHGDPFGR